MLINYYLVVLIVVVEVVFLILLFICYFVIHQLFLFLELLPLSTFSFCKEPEDYVIWCHLQIKTTKRLERQSRLVCWERWCLADGYYLAES